jgi:hypothetical protein
MMWGYRFASQLRTSLCKTELDSVIKEAKILTGPQNKGRKKYPPNRILGSIQGNILLLFTMTIPLSSTSHVTYHEVFTHKKQRKGGKRQKREYYKGIEKNKGSEL